MCGFIVGGSFLVICPKSKTIIYYPAMHSKTPSTTQNLQIKTCKKHMLASPSPKRCGIEIQTNGRATSLDPGAGGWVGKGRAEKAEETSDAEIDLNFDVVQMGF